VLVFFVGAWKEDVGAHFSSFMIIWLSHQRRTVIVAATQAQTLKMVQRSFGCLHVDLAKESFCKISGTGCLRPRVS
jgi:hypothetical membrane protein